MSEPTPEQGARPCPFCGSLPEFLRLARMVECPNSLCHFYYNLTPMETWQCRPIEDALRAELGGVEFHNSALLMHVDSLKAEVARLTTERELNKDNYIRYKVIPTDWDVEEL